MFEKREELLMSQAELREILNKKWRRAKIVVLFITSTLVILSFTVALIGVQAAEFMFVVSRWMQSSCYSVPCLYVVLNILILTLGVKSGALTTSTSTSISHFHCFHAHQYKTDNSSDALVSSYEKTISSAELKAENCCDDGSLKAVEVQKPSSLVLQRSSCDNGSLKAVEVQKPSSLVLHRSSSLRELHCKKVNKLPNLSKESAHTHPHHMYKNTDAASIKVIFEICSGEGCVDGYTDKENEGSLSCEELNAKAESFIGNFYRELKMQREDSWKRLCAIYNRSC